ncbi:RNA polymerase sigma factor SigZ [Photobacterium makurazakiensis]|uniref:RNA polymerase sigma factor SigZ n=1 Tax=Photobacterium makurazakiensis TaxID=2910234 RepID=UPI003D11957C
MNVEVVWNEYSSSLKAFLHSKVSDHDDVDDLLQDILIKTHHNLNNLKERSKVKSWLFQIANNSIIDFYRKKARAKDLTEDDLWYKEDDVTIHQELSECVVPMLQALPKADADMLIAIEINGQSQKEYAEEKGIKYSTLKSRVQKSREKMHGLFQECCDLSLDSHGNVMGYEEKENSCGKC